MGEIKLPYLPDFEEPDRGRCFNHDEMRNYARAAVELDRASRPAGEAVAYRLMQNGLPAKWRNGTPSAAVIAYATDHGMLIQQAYLAPPAVSEDVRELLKDTREWLVSYRIGAELVGRIDAALAKFAGVVP